jgi:hypothetical protein
MDGSFLFSLNENAFKMGILFVSVVLFAYNAKYRDMKIIMTLAFLLISIIFVRQINHGGIGMDVWILFASQMLIAFLAVYYRRDTFIEVYIKVVYFLAVISLISWIIALINPNILKPFLSANVAVNYDNSIFYGKLFFVIHNNNTRNVGIYPEPGVYQIALNMALYLLLFYGHKANFTKKQTIHYLMTFILTLLSAQSTSGYLSMMAVLLGFAVSRHRWEMENRRIKRYILIVAALLLCILMIDYNIQGEDSLISRIVLQKLFSGNRFDLSSSTGKYRVESIRISMDSIINNPLGQGYDYLNMVKRYAKLEAVGNGLLSTIAALGVIPMLVILYRMLIPIFKYGASKIAFLIFVFMFVNTTLAQTYVFYPSFFMLTFLAYSQKECELSYEMDEFLEFQKI